MAKVVLIGRNGGGQIYGLELTGHEILIANKKDAMDKALEHEAHIIVMLTEGMDHDSLELATSILRTCPWLRIIIVSSHEEFLRRLRNLGFRHRVASANEVAIAIDEIVERYPGYGNEQRPEGA